MYIYADKLRIWYTNKTKQNKSIKKKKKNKNFIIIIAAADKIRRLIFLKRRQ